MTQAQLDNVIFPLGELRKPEVRKIAEENGLATHSKKDSTGICFIGERRFKDFLAQYLPANPGDIVTLDGRVIGEHQGLMYHTLGQRQGLGIGGQPGLPEAPWYVVAKDLIKNELVVAQGNDHPALFCRQMHVNDICWIGSPPPLPGRLKVKVRYRQADQDCTLTTAQDGYAIAFDQPQRAVTPGQWACFYQDDICLGGGIIISTDQH